MPKGGTSATIVLMLPQGLLRWRPLTPLERRASEPPDEYQIEQQRRDEAGIMGRTDPDEIDALNTASEDRTRETEAARALYRDWLPRLSHLDLLPTPPLRLPLGYEPCQCASCRARMPSDELSRSPLVWDTPPFWETTPP